MKYRCNRVIVVEGKYDRIRLESFLDATVITTEGFGIFRDPEKKDLLRRLAETRGIVLLCDSDGGGKLIRSHLHTVTGGKGVTDLYIPPVKGKEKRKAQSGKEGLLGVEGMDNETLTNLFRKAGLLSEDLSPRKTRYTKLDLYRLGYTGKDGAEEKRSELLKKHRLPTNLSSNAFLDIINLLEISL